MSNILHANRVGNFQKPRKRNPKRKRRKSLLEPESLEHFWPSRNTGFGGKPGGVLGAGDISCFVIDEAVGRVKPSNKQYASYVYKKE